MNEVPVAYVIARPDARLERGRAARLLPGQDRVLQDPAARPLRRPTCRARRARTATRCSASSCASARSRSSRHDACGPRSATCSVSSIRSCNRGWAASPAPTSWPRCRRPAAWGSSPASTCTPDQIRDAIRRVRARHRPAVRRESLHAERAAPAHRSRDDSRRDGGRGAGRAQRLPHPPRPADDDRAAAGGARSHRRRLRGDPGRAGPRLVDRSRRPRTRDGRALSRPRHEGDGDGHDRGGRAHPRARTASTCWWRRAARPAATARPG